MLRRRDVKGSNRREGAEADTAENSGMMAVLVLDRDKVPTAFARYGHGSERSRMCWRACLVLVLSTRRPVRLSRLGVRKVGQAAADNASEPGTSRRGDGIISHGALVTWRSAQLTCQRKDRGVPKSPCVS
jgi:hypothetical protein